MIFRDLTFAIRVLLRHRYSTGLCIAVLALGFTAVISVYAVVHRFVLSPLPYPDSVLTGGLFAIVPALRACWVAWSKPLSSEPRFWIGRFFSRWSR